MARIVDRVRQRANSAEERASKADEVEDSAKQLLTIWKQNVGHGCSWYMHSVAHHLPDMIRRLPCDILDASGESMEQKNQRSKWNFRR